MGVFVFLLIWSLILNLIHGHSLFTCEPITIPRCSGMAYNMTFFPNIMGHYDQDTAAVQMEPFLPLLNIHCSPDVCTFLCKAFVPACMEQTRVIHPCRSLCKRVHSDCKQLINTFGIVWPEELECDRLEDCDESAPVTVSLTTRAHDVQKTPGQPRRDYGFWCPRHLQTAGGQGYKFLEIDQCAPPCPNMYFSNHELDVAKSFIGIVSIFCLCATLFTFLTFLIDVKRFRYPERPIIYYSVCYSIVSLMYFLGFVLGNRAACNKLDEKLQTGETVVLGSQNKGCTIIFMALYFFTMAGTVWWVILTVTWFLAAGRKWSCEAIEQKAMWFHAVAWGMPGSLTIMLLAMNKVEGDNISGVCFVGLYDLDASRYFVLLPLCLCVFVGLSLLLAGIISLNHVRQVIQNDGRNQEKLKKFMIRIGVFSGLYLVPLVMLLGCYIYEQVYRKIWETTWVYDHCNKFHIPCPYQVQVLARPEISLFLIKYLMTLIVGISPVFWVGSKKTCSEWASFFNRNRKRDPISESRRVLQESCEFFLKHNSKAKHKKKHYKSGSHKLKVISKSMGTSTSVATNHGTSAVAIANHDYLSQETFTEIKSCPDASERAVEADGTPSLKVDEEEFAPSEQSALQTRASPKVALEQVEKRGKADNMQDMVSLSESKRRMAEGRSTPKSDFIETRPLQVSHTLLDVSQPGSTKGSVLLLAPSSSDSRKAQESGNSSNA
ncbi:frizzled-6 isoform X1 [Hemicordylus capensis]|uniref:frizzled-6 isoform X1 n=2 Tax=Hemicordylus capensis TaxID=884348 RepID=UPI00230483B7|nr:frizzled-6 isoform X1 [Hemicordylus capensis]XP_053099447.1 frizzled-6 isoform X1 [Hemicordylus capensis]XP_053099448.1 frizzled-6 isoform X1 [Hemicordylus capensis]XP_053099449.1 frizzled-6 isoform X1 [Hemicordylus capensis]XP_053099450.1 frizzled-6 isoform X1 [Hemicordylus capensis]